MRALVFVVLIACSKKEPPKNLAAEARAAARSEFELISDDYRLGTSKLYARGDFLPVGDDKAFDEGDFVGRLRALFGEVPGDDYVLRHRASGLVVTAYARQSGPSYGGRPRDPGIAADPELAKGPPVDWSQMNIAAMSRSEVQALRAKEQAWMKRMADARAPEGFPPVVARLDALVAAVPPADWEAVRYWSEEPSVSRIGVRSGKSFAVQLPPAEGLEVLLVDAERQLGAIIDSAGGITGADERVVEYFAYCAQQGEVVEAARPRVHAAWFRWAKEIAAEDDANLYKSSVEAALERAAELGIDPAKARDALQR